MSVSCGELQVRTVSVRFSDVLSPILSDPFNGPRFLSALWIVCQFRHGRTTPVRVAWMAPDTGMRGGEFSYAPALSWSETMERLQHGTSIHRTTTETSPLLRDFMVTTGDETPTASHRLMPDPDRFDPTAWVLESHPDAPPLPPLFCDRLSRLGESAIANDALPVSRLPLLTDWDQERIRAWGGSDRALSTVTVIDRIREQARYRPEAIAIESGETSLSYGELDETSDAFARHLMATGVLPGETIAVCMDRTPFWVTALAGILKSGAAYLPLDPGHPDARLTQLLTIGHIRKLVCDTRYTKRFSQIPDLSIETADTPATRWFAAPPAPKRDPHPAEAAYVIFTSGSTGTPKGVQISHASLSNLCRWHEDTFLIGPDTRSSHVAGMAFDAGVLELWPFLSCGATIRLADPDFSMLPEHLRDWFFRHAIDITFLPTPVAESFLGIAFPKDYPLRTILTGGDRLRKRPSEEIPFQLINNYGPTEATVVATSGIVRPGSETDANPDIGTPVSGTIIRILDRSFQPVPPGVAGELCIGGCGLMMGYLDRPDLTAERMVHDPETGRPLYRTGDRARFLEDGSIAYMGRDEEQVQIHGVRVEPGEVEAALLTAPGVTGGIVIVREDRAGRPSLLGYVTGTTDTGAVRQHLKTLLVSAMVPAKILSIPEIPLTRNGKPDRSLLPEPEDTAGTPPLPGMETQVAQLFSACFENAPIFRESDFFVLGGHSLLAARLAEKIQQHTGIAIPLSDLIRFPTVADLAAFLVTCPQTEKTPLPVPEGDMQDRHAPFPLTDVQQAYWMGRRPDLPLGGTATHLYLEIDPTERDPERLAKAFDAVVAHHDMLRAVITEDGSQQILELVPPVTIPVTEIPLSGRKPEAIFATIRKEMAHQVLPPDRWPLFDIRMTRLDCGTTRLHLYFDALILDYNSMLRVVDQWTRKMADPDLTLPQVPVSFRDYIAAYTRLSETKGFSESLAYWEERIAAISPPPDLPLACDPQTLKAPRFVRHARRVAKPKWDAFQARCRTAGCTPSAALLTAYAEVLRLWSHTDRFTLNLTLFNRLPFAADLTETMGDFTSLTLLSCEPEGESFQDRCRILQHRLFSDLEHRAVSGLRVMRKLNETIRQKGMPVVFTSGLGAGDADGMPLDGGVFDRLGTVTYALTETPQVWIDCQVTEADGDLLLSWDVPGTLFPKGMISDMFASFTDLILRMAGHSSLWRKDTVLPLPASQKTVRKQVNATGIPATPTCLHQPFFSRAGQTPDALAVSDGEQNLTYGALACRVDALAARIRQWDVAPGDVVAISIRPGWRQAVAALAVHRAGCAYLPVDPALPRERRSYLLQAAAAKAVLTDPETDRLAWPRETPRLTVPEARPTAVSIPPHPAQSPEDLAYVIFTSGSTGTPKGVMVTHGAAWNTVADVAERMHITPKDRILAVSALHFDLSVFDLFAPLAKGAAIVYPAADLSRDPGHWCERMQEAGVTLWNSVPALMGMLLDYGGPNADKAIKGLRQAIFSGDWIPTDLPDRIRNHAPEIRLAALGGATEAAIWSNWFSIETVDPNTPSIPYGTPLSAQRYHVLDREYRDCPDHVIGSLFISGAGLASGYLNDPVQTAARFFPHPVTGERLYRTGDRACYRSDGVLIFHGREDDQVKIRGHRIEPGEAQVVLCRHPDVEKAVVAPRPGPAGDAVLVAWYCASTEDLTGQDLAAFCRDHLPQALIPEAFTPVAAIPLSANGKVDIPALPAPDWEKWQAVPFKSGKKEATEHSAFEAELLALFAKALAIPDPDPSASFFDLGADSIRLVRFQGMLERHLEKRVPIVTLFAHPSIHRLALFLMADQNHSTSKTQEETRRIARRKARRNRTNTAAETTVTPEVAS